MSFKVVIPARYGSSRLPAKPLRNIAGKPMIQHVWEKAVLSGAGEVVVATDHAAILEACEAFGARVMLTAEEHPSGTDRLHEVCESLEWPDETIVVNLQGDEPLFPAELIDVLAGNLASQPDCAIATFCQPIESWQQFLDPNVVKVVINQKEQAMYFSRAPIPWDRNNQLSVKVHDLEAKATNYLLDYEVHVGKPRAAFRHIGIYAYRVSTLNQYVAITTAEKNHEHGHSDFTYEDIERLEQLRALDHGMNIHCPVTDVSIPDGVDTEADLTQVIEAIQRRQESNA